MKALKDKVEPYIVRDVSMLEVGQVLIADGHTLNFQVINPFTGRPSRATLLGFLDWKSEALVGYDIMLEECTQNIASALRNSILNLDHIPQFVYQDNGRAFKSKFFNGDKNFEELGFVLLTGIGKAYPLVRSHTILNNLHSVLDKIPVIMFYPGRYDQKDLKLFNNGSSFTGLKDDNYYRAFKLVEN
ncbi:MAG: DUF1788 domain-containing protein [Candidatus Gastranaerophilaceae bacterium]